MYDKIIPLTSETKYEVFISSNKRPDVVQVTDCIINATAKKGQISCTMDSFAGPGNYSFNEEACRDYIMRSDIFVIIVGAHYGSDLNGKPFIAVEYEIAKDLKKPIIVILLKEGDARTFRKLLVVNDKAEEKHDNGYWKFRKKFDNNNYTKIPFGIDPDIKVITDDYVDALNKIINNLNGKNGWNWANSELTADIIAKLNSNTTLGNRTKKNSDFKKVIAQYFIREYLEGLIMNDYLKFFFESGSSTAFAAKEFVKFVKEDPHMEWAMKSSYAQIKTNNVQANIYFLLNQRLKKLEIYPQGLPNDEYGATYGKLVDFDAYKTDQAKQEDFNFLKYLAEHDEIKTALTEITSELNEDYIDPTEKGMIFMAASGVENSAGPFVGSFKNMLFKKALLASKCPTVLFLDQKKLTKKSENRYFVCDNTLKWKDICKGSICSPFADPDKSFAKPFAIAIGIRAAAYNQTKKILQKDLFFDKIAKKNIQINDRKFIGIVAANDAFWEIIK
jgi:hypothetical protein